MCFPQWDVNNHLEFKMHYRHQQNAEGTVLTSQYICKVKTSRMSLLAFTQEILKNKKVIKT